MISIKFKSDKLYLNIQQAYPCGKPQAKDANYNWSFPVFVNVTILLFPSNAFFNSCLSPSVIKPFHSSKTASIFGTNQLTEEKIINNIRITLDCTTPSFLGILSIHTEQ